MVTTSIFAKNLLAYKKGTRLIINEGGTGSSKTFSAIQLVALIAMIIKNPVLISIVGESIPFLKRGCIRDFENIMAGEGLWNPARYNITDRIYKFDSGSKIEFIPADESSKLRGARRDILYINEVNNISKKSYDELDVRTNICTIVDYNPVQQFFIHDLIGTDNTEYIHSTYMDALHVLPAGKRQDIEKRRDTDQNWWRVYGLGLVGNVVGLVHPTFTLCDNIPQGQGIEGYGLDFGFSNDPTALTFNKITKDTIYSDQIIYETGLVTSQIISRMEQAGIRKNYDEIFADSSDPRTIREIRNAGFNIRGCIKGDDSLIHGIQKVNEFKQVWTKRSVDCIKEQRNYRYIETQDGKLTNKAIDDWNHGMDSRRYAVTMKTRRQGQALDVAI